MIIAAYNEEKRLSETVKKLEAELKNRGIEYEIIVCSDGSTDRTIEVAKNLNLKAVGYKDNKGFTTALRFGFKYSSGEIILNLPADVDNFEFLDSIKYTKNYDVVSISKRHKQSMVKGYGFKRWLISNTFHHIEKILFGSLLATTDTHYITIYKRKVLEKVYPYCKSAHWGGETEAIVLAKYFGFTFTDVPIHLIHEAKPTHFLKEIKVYLKTFWELINVKIRLGKMKNSVTK